MTKTFNQLVDELHSEMVILKRKYPLIHMTEQEKERFKFSQMLSNVSIGTSNWGKIMGEAIVAGFASAIQGFVELGESFTKAIEAMDSFDLTHLANPRCRLLFMYPDWLDFWPVNIILWPIWEKVVEFWPERWLPKGDDDE